MSKLIHLIALLNACFFTTYLVAQPNSSATQITVSYEYGTTLSPSANTNIYTIWIENTSSAFIQNLRICQSLINGGLTNTALPFWNLNKRSISSSTEINAVTSATQKNTSFSITATIKDPSIRKFTSYFEIDRSFETNDWFSDQPAVLYAAEINLDDTATTYELKPVGWTPNEGTENIIPNTPKGVLQKEMRYITNHKNGSGFGDADPKSLTSIVKRITLSQKKIPLKVKTSINNTNIQIITEKTNEISITSRNAIDVLSVFDLQGRYVYSSRPGSKHFTIDLGTDKFRPGMHFVKIISGNQTTCHPIVRN